MNPRIVLDTSSILTYARDNDASVGVSEPIRELADEGALCGLPALCLADATRVATPTESALLDVLVALPNIVVLPATGEWRDLGFSARMYDGLARAAARLAAIEHGAYLLTAEPGVYGGPDTDGIIPAG